MLSDRHADLYREVRRKTATAVAVAAWCVVDIVVSSFREWLQAPGLVAERLDVRLGSVM
jgi:hypothetical protein